MDLFVFAIGGNAGKSNIEVHDIQFVIAEKPEEAWPTLREHWFGDQDKIHLDGYGRLRWVNGYRVSVSKTPPASELPKLFFVNVGAYCKTELMELHAFDFFVANNATDAKKQALESLLSGEQQQHKDNLKDVDDCKLLSEIGDYYLHLEPHAEGTPFIPEWQGYQPIGL
nr:DUF1543 domain-containing protein [uncultured Tolumonas sp.]